MPDVSELADALVESPLPQHVLPVPTGPPVDAPPPRLAPALPILPTIARPSLPTSAKSSAASSSAAPTGEASAAGVDGSHPQAVEEPDPMAAAAASGNPHAMAAAAHFAAMKHAASLPSAKSARPVKRRRSRKPIVVPVLLLGALGGAAYVGRDSTLMTRLQGDGYDSTVLPMVVYPRPTPAGVERSVTEYSVTIDAAGVPTVVEEFADILTNSGTGDRSVEKRVSRFAVADGDLTEPASSVEEQEFIVVGEFAYLSPEVDGEPWERQERAWRTIGPEIGDVWMYQDLVDQSLRHVPPVSTTSEIVDAVDVTTYRWEIPFGELYESAPFAYSPFGVLNGNADPASMVTLVISVDAEGVVRVVDIRLDLDAVIDHANERADGLSYPYGYRVELDSLDDIAPTITAPTDVAPPTAPAEPAAEGGV